jgi:hypothetical protein
MGKPQPAARANSCRARRFRYAFAASITLSLAALSACSTPASPSPSAAQSSLPASPTAPSIAPSPPRGSSPATPGSIWQPKPGLTWQWQLSGSVDTSVNAQVYDIDGGENSAAVVATLHAAGRKVICYVNAGAYESFRTDANRFPAAIIGQSNGWPEERWLDVRQLNVLRPILADRFKSCAQKGFDGIEADNVDGYRNDTGFPLTAADQLAFNRMVADLAHAARLAIGLKNDLDQIPQLVPDFDFAVNEQCAEYAECGDLKPFIAAGKAVFHVEYNLPLNEFCPETTALGLSSMRKNLSLDAPRWPCPAP